MSDSVQRVFERLAGLERRSLESGDLDRLTTLEDGKLVYENGYWALKEYDESGEGWIQDESYEESGYFYLNSSGELCWHDDRAERPEDSAFILAA